MHDLDGLISELRTFSDEKYRTFNEGLTPGIEGKSLGVRMPKLRSISHMLLKKDPHAFLHAAEACDIHEIRLLCAILIARGKMTVDERRDHLCRFVPSIDNWAVCDLLCCDMKLAIGELAEYYSLLSRFAASDREFEVRFALVMLMMYYHGEEWFDRTLAIYTDFRHNGYYARMGAAWGLSMLFVRQRERVLRFLETDTLDSFTHNKAIQKCIESRQVSPEDKELLRSLRRNV